MRQLLAWSIALPLVLTIVACGGTRSITGVWKGGIVVDRSKLSPTKTVQEKTLQDAMVERLETSKYTIDLKDDNTYTLNATRAELGEVKSEGVWERKEATITFQPKSNTIGNKLTFQLSEDKSTMTSEESSSVAGMRIVLKKG